MRIKAKRIKGGFLIPFFDESLRNKESINVEIPLEELLTDEYIEKHWLELVMTSTDPFIDDDERLPEAYCEYLKESQEVV
jgi:hypothetical protein